MEPLPREKDTEDTGCNPFRKRAMTRPEAQMIFVREGGQLCAGGMDLGKSRLVRDGDGFVGSFALVDTFDGQVAAKDRLLLETEEGLFLLSEEGVLDQSRCAPAFVQDMPEGPVSDWLAGVVSPLRTLMPVAKGELVRQRWKVVDDFDKTEVRGESWQLRSGNAAPVTVLRLNPLRGYDKALQRFVHQIDTTGSRLCETAFDLGADLRGVEPGTIGKVEIEMTAEETAFEATVVFVRAQVAAAVRQEAGILADLDSEFLHEYRVALRRVRSVISLFRGVFEAEQSDELKQRFDAVMSPTGRLRDLDVYLIEREDYVALVPPARRRGVEKLFDRLARERGDAHRDLAAWLQSPGYRQEMAALLRLFEDPGQLAEGPDAESHALDYARRVIWKRYRKVCKIAAGIDSTTPDEQVHALRIQCKKLRYLMEFFAPLFDAADVGALIKRLKKLQDNLGKFNDYAVQQAALGDLLTGLRANTRDALEIATSLGALVTVLDRKQHEERARVEASFARFDSEKTRESFRTLFHSEEPDA